MHTEQIQKIVDQTVDSKRIFGAQLSLRHGNDLFHTSAGNLIDVREYFIASTTKLYITALFLKLKYENGFDLYKPISEFLDSNVLNGLHVYKQKDYSNVITINHLLSQTSGLPDYFQQNFSGEKSLLEFLMSNNDVSWTFDDVVSWSKKRSPKFAPGAAGKAFYSDTNFQLLGRILEVIYALPIEQILKKELFDPLALINTFLYTDSSNFRPQSIYYKSTLLNMPKAMASFKADGGIVSNSEESLKFLEAFFNNKFFPQAYLSDLYKWNRIFFPLQYGAGITLFKLPRIFSPFKALPELIGHSGLSGAFSYYCPSKDLYLCGTVNQIYQPGNSYRMMLKIINLF